MHSIIEINPRYQETDQMGIIHHSVYAIWYEMGRIRLIEDVGLNFHEIEKQGLYLALVSMSSTYQRPAVFGEKYTLETNLVSLKNVRMVFSHTIRDRQGTLINQGQTALAWVDHLLKPMSIRKSHPEIYDAFRAMITDEESGSI